MQHGNRKTSRQGGNIKNSIFKHILSIGYELESYNFAKLSLLDTGVLLNTDTVAKNLAIINQSFKGDPEDDPMFRRKQEPVAFPAYTTYSIDSPGKKTADPNVSFQVLNDIAEISFNKYLSSLCKDYVEANIAVQKQERIEQEGDEDLDETELENELLYEIKNELYRFRSLDGSKEYAINFETWNPKECGTFSDIEWLFTYYKPQRSGHIILDTFVNLAKNFIHHLQQLTPMPGNVIIHFSQNDQEIVGSPKTRILYNYPGTNLYYLQTHRSNKQLGIEDVCFVPQMTFSCDIQHAADILMEMMHDTVGKLKLNKEVANRNFGVLKRLNHCVELLFKPYHKIFDPKSENTRRIRNYVFMILFKLSRYYNAYLASMKARDKYFKDALFFNSRHDNGELYNNLKKLVAEVLGGSSEIDIAAIIQDLIIQPSILEKYLVDDIKYVRKNAFMRSNTLEKSNSHYGDPVYSLVSYFQFLEDPIVEEDASASASSTPRSVDSSAYTIASSAGGATDSAASSIATLKGSSSKSNDWFVYANIDVFSTRMEIKNHVVLIEMRFFAYMMRSYMSSIADTELRTEMREGICNVNNPDVNFISVRGLNHMLELIKHGHGSSPKSGRSTKKRSVASSKKRSASSQSV